MSSLKHVFHMAAAVAPDVKERWIDWLGPDRIMEVYAATEVVGGTIISGGEWLNKRGSVGRPFMGSQVKIVTEDGAVAAPGEVGEVYMMPERGAGSTYHYLGAERRADAKGWESVGDIGWLDEDGYLFLADRRADLILRGGANIYPAEIEAVLELHPDVATAVAVGLPDADLGQRVHAIIEPKAGRAVDEAALAALMVEHLARFKHPQSYEFVSEPLRDEAGKVRRSALRDARL
jgi:bile acid-coenzyme A ligase